MKVAKLVLKCVALGLAVSGAVCLVIAYWDKIADAFYNLMDKVEEKKAAACASEFDDYDDFEDWETC